MNTNSWINEEHGYYKISKENISLLIDNYCKNPYSNFIIYIDRDKDFDSFRNVTELITSFLEEKKLEYKFANFPVGCDIIWLIPEQPKNETDTYRKRGIHIYWYSSENKNPLQFKGKKAANILLSDSLFEDSDFLLWASYVNTHDFLHYKFKTGFKEIDDRQGSD